MNYIIAQILGALAIGTGALCTYQKTKGKVLIWDLITCIIYMLEYSLLGAFSAVISDGIIAIKNIAFYKYAKNEKKVPKFMFLACVIAIIICGIFIYSGIVSVVPLLLAVLLIYGTWQDNLKVYRIINVVTTFFWLIYNIYFGAHTSAIGNGVQIIACITAIIRIDMVNSKTK